MGASEILLAVLWIILGVGIFIGWIWIVKKYIFRTGKFTCKKCHKQYYQQHETENNLCQWCKEGEQKKKKIINNHVLY